MNSHSDMRLRILVENAVRPIRAGMHRKLQMREAMFARLSALFEEEAEGRSEQGALDRALDRFGNLSEFGAVLGKTVGVADWAGWFLERQVFPQPGEVAIRIMLRHILLSCIAFYSFALVLLALVLTPPNRSALFSGSHPDLVLAACIGSLFSIALIVALSHGIWWAFYGTDGHRWLRRALCVVGGCLFAPSMLYSWAWLAPPDEKAKMLEEIAAHMPFLVVVTPYTLIFHVRLVWRILHGSRRPWLCNVGIDLMAGIALSAASFLLAYALTGDVSVAAGNALGIASVSVWWLLPYGFIASTPLFGSRIRAHREWEALNIGETRV